MPPHRIPYTVALTCISRALVMRDKLFKPGSAKLRARAPGIVVSREFVPSGENQLDTAFVQHGHGTARAGVLICHGIGENVDRWFPVQQLLARNGVASLVFDYSGYGRSTGTVDWRQCEEDARVAFEHLRRVAGPLPVSILGYSLGSGIAAAIIHSIKAERLVLCAAFTSFRAGARSAGIPRVLRPLVPHIWQTETTLKDCAVPVLVVHGEEDGLFPVQMARDLVASCGGDVELVVVPGVGHNRPFRQPDLHYWGRIIDRLVV